MTEDSKKHEIPNDVNNVLVLVDGALSWWNSITFEEQFYKTIAWLKDQNRNVTERHPHKLSVEEIVGVYQLHLR